MQALFCTNNGSYTPPEYCSTDCPERDHDWDRPPPRIKANPPKETGGISVE